MSGPYPGNIDQASNTLGCWLRHAARILLEGDTNQKMGWAATALGFAADAADREEKALKERLEHIEAIIGDRLIAVTTADPDEPAPLYVTCNHEIKWCEHPAHEDGDDDMSDDKTIVDDDVPF